MTVTETAPAVEVRGLHKRYGDRAVLRGVDLTIERGQVFALLGPNGAGKTTTVEILEGFRDPTAGTVRVLGFDPARQRPNCVNALASCCRSAASRCTCACGSWWTRGAPSTGHPPARRAARRRRPRGRDQHGGAQAVGRAAPPPRLRARARRATRSSSSSTSPRPGSIPKHGVDAGPPSRTCVTSARRSCSPRTTSTKRSRLRTTSPSSATVASARPAHRPRLARQAGTEPRMALVQPRLEDVYLELVGKPEGMS